MTKLLLNCTTIMTTITSAVIISRPCLSNGRAIGIVVRLSVCLSVRPSVCNRCIVAKLKIVGKNFLQA